MKIQVFSLLVGVIVSGCDQLSGGAGSSQPSFLDRVEPVQSSRCSLDLVTIEPGTDGKYIGRIGGWIADDSLSESPSEVYVTALIDGKTLYFKADQFDSDDVAKALNAPTLTRVRFDATFDLDAGKARFGILANIGEKAVVCYSSKDVGG